MDFFQSENGASKRCFAAAGFTDKTKRFAFGDGQRDVVNGFDMARHEIQNAVADWEPYA